MLMRIEKDSWDVILEGLQEGALRYREQGDKEQAATIDELIKSLRQLGKTVLGGETLEGYWCECVIDGRPRRVEIRVT